MINFLKSKRAELSLIIILLINIILKWKTFNGLVQADDFSYGVYGFSMFRLPFPWDMSIDFRELRYALLLPVALIFSVFQPSEAAVVAYPFMLSCGTVLMVYLIGKKIYGTAAGLFGAFALATFPQDILYGTMLMPDIIVPFFISAALYLYLIALESKKLKSHILYAFSGIMVFLAFSARENSYYFLLFFLPFIFDRKRWKSGLYLIGVGFAVPVLLLYLFFYLKSGDFLYQLHLARNAAEPLIESGYIPPNYANKVTILYYMFPFIFKGVNFGNLFLSNLYGLGFIAGTPFLLYSIIKGILKRKWVYLLIPWWFLITYLYLEFGTISFSDYQMMKKLPRFLLTMTPALAVGFGLVMSEILGWGFFCTKKKTGIIKKISSVSAVTLFFLFHLYLVLIILVTETGTYKNNNLKYRWAYYEILKDKPHKPVYTTGGWWNNKLSFYFLPDIRYADLQWRKSDMLRNIFMVKNSESLADSYVLIDRSHFVGNDFKIDESYSALPPYLVLPPKEWKLLGSEYKIDIFQVPENWKYIEPDQREYVLGLFYYSLKINDALLLYESLHPDMTTLMSLEDYFDFYKKASNQESPETSKLMETMEYREYDGKMKLFFNIQQKEGNQNEK